MIYTIGHEASYLKAIANNKGLPIQKLGRREPCEKFQAGFEGGCCFRDVKDAQIAIDIYCSGRGFIVWGLDTVWENTKPSNCHFWNDLIKDSDIIVLEKSSA